MDEIVGAIDEVVDDDVCGNTICGIAFKIFNGLGVLTEE